MPTTGKVGKAYGATNTPNMFVIDKTGTVVNAGRSTTRATARASRRRAAS